MRYSKSIWVRTVAMLPVFWLMLNAVGTSWADSQAKTFVNARRFSYDQDLAAFKRARGQLFQLTTQVKQRSDLFGPKSEKDLTLLRPDVRRQIHAFWFSVLDNYLALDELGETHMGFSRQRDKKARSESFHVARGVFLTQYRVALELIAVLEQNPLMDTILNEPDPLMGLPKGVYAHFKFQYLNVIKAGNFAALEAVALSYGKGQDSQLAQWAMEDRQIILDAGKGPGPVMTLKNGLAIIERLGHKVWFPVQKGVASWMGKTKVWRRHHSLIQPRQIETLSKHLEPGDILLERREWYMTNVGIPGFWTHAALYVGSIAQRDAFSKQPEVKEWLRQQQADGIDDLIKKRYPNAYMAMIAPDEKGRLAQVIEAISPGVSLTSLYFSAGCDSLAVLRPRLSKADRAAAVVRAMAYYGRPYDYDFDFGSDTRLVCTELVVKSYLTDHAKQGLQLPLENLMGHMVTPANSFVQQFDQTFNTDAQQLDLVLFLDGNEKEQRAVTSGVDEFRNSWRRPKWHILIQDINQSESETGGV